MQSFNITTINIYLPEHLKSYVLNYDTYLRFYYNVYVR